MRDAFLELVPHTQSALLVFSWEPEHLTLAATQSKARTFELQWPSLPPSDQLPHIGFLAGEEINHVVH